MPARETEAIILKTFALGEADRLVSFQSAPLGPCGGARRIKNRYGSTLELLAHVQLWYVERETRDLVRIQQAELLESFNRSQSDYELEHPFARATVELVLPVESRPGADVRSGSSCSRCARSNAAGVGILPLSYFAFWTVRLAGWLPRSIPAPIAASRSGRSRPISRPLFPACTARNIAVPA